MPVITALGVGSGINVAELVAELVAAEGAPATARLDRREADLQAKISAYGTLKSALSDFQDAVTKLKDAASPEDVRTATSGNEDLFTASADSSASAGSYDIEVLRRAEAQKLLSGEFASVSTVVGTGTLTITVGGQAFEVAVDESNNTLAGIAEAITQALDNSGVSATIINVDNQAQDGTISKLVLTADEAGADNTITVSVVDDDGQNIDDAGLSQLYYDPADSSNSNLSEIQAAVDSQMLIDGQSVTRSSNSIADAIQGVTIELEAAAPGTVSELVVTESLDTSGVTAAVNGFVEGFNGLIDTLGQVSNFDPNTQVASSLFGDSATRNVALQIRRALSGQVAGAEPPFDTLFSLGITTEAAGKLSADTAKLADALEQDVEVVADLFAGEDGIAERLEEVLSGYTESGGIIAARTDGLNNRIEDITDSRDALAQRLERLEARLTAQFRAMDELVAQLQSTSNFLTQQFAQLQNLVSSNRTQQTS
jgi:flagellar hook-associated protein 2